MSETPITSLTECNSDTTKKIAHLELITQLSSKYDNYIQHYIYRVSHELRSLLRESVPYVKIYRYNPKHLCPKLNGYGDSGKRKVWTS